MSPDCSVTKEGIAGELLEMAWEPEVQEVRGALDRARRKDGVDEVRPGIFRVKTGTERPQLARRDLQSLIRKLRKAILNQPLANRRLALARLLLNVEDEISSVVPDIVATAVEESRRSAPDETRAFLDGVLAMPEVWLHPR